MNLTSAWKFRACVAAAVLGASGCGNALIFSTSTLYGIELNALEGGQQTVKFAMQRLEGVSMPACKYKTPSDWFDMRPCRKGKMLTQAYATLAIMDTSTGALLLPDLNTGHVTQVFATGSAAAKPGAPKTTANTFAALSGKVAYETTDQQDLQAAFDAVGAQSKADERYERAAQMLPDTFRKAYVARKEAKPPFSNAQAFLAAKNAFTFGEGSSGAKLKQVTESLEAVSK